MASYMLYTGTCDIFHYCLYDSNSLSVCVCRLIVIINTNAVVFYEWHSVAVVGTVTPTPPESSLGFDTPPGNVEFVCL